LISAAKRFNLTDREIEVLLLLAAGGTYKSAASDLGVSDKTISYHIFHVHLKVRCQSTVATIYLLMS